jgi:hypothetical protein
VRVGIYGKFLYELLLNQPVKKHGLEHGSRHGLIHIIQQLGIAASHSS